MKLILSLLCFFHFVFAEQLRQVGKIEQIIGEAIIKRGNDVINVDSSGVDVYKSDVIKTIGDSKLKIRFVDNTVVVIGQKSTLEIAKYYFDTNDKAKSETDLKILNGSFKIKTGDIGDEAPQNFKIRTKLATIGIRG